MAASNITSDKKPQIYDLIYRMNASFARATRNLFELEKTGIFDAQMMSRIYNETKEAQSGANFHLLEALQQIEQKDWARFGRRSRPSAE